MSLDIFLTNNLTNKKEKFIPQDKNNVRMYVCGPTVYDDPHIGNARPVVVFDILFKILKNKLIGYNTDYLGFINSFNEKLDYKNVLILGSGGASKAIQYAIKTKKINFDVASRKSDVNHIAYTQIESLEKYDLIVNCTPLGTYPNVNDKPDLNYDQLNDKHLCYDLIYNPSETLFLNESKKRGARILNGLQMLKLQAEESWKIWNS